MSETRLYMAFGGRENGRYLRVPSSLLPGDCWRVSQYKPMELLGPMHELPQVAAQVDYEEYVLEAVRTRTAEHRFLRYAGIAVDKILRKIFGEASP
jgi:hypothetical protein